MADFSDRWEDNCDEIVKFNGKAVSFYCDNACIHCDVCQENGPDNFRSSDDKKHSICFKQPASEEELKLCYQAMECCPVGAIGDDGHKDLQEASCSKSGSQSLLFKRYPIRGALDSRFFWSMVQKIAGKEV